MSTPLRHAPLDDLNQHWWSPGTTAALVAECLAHGGRAAFLSTPSLYCALPPGPLRRGSTVFDVRARSAGVGPLTLLLPALPRLVSASPLTPSPLPAPASVCASQFDRRFADLGANYEFYDFRCPQDLPARHRGVYDFIVVDPPFIAPSVWELYARAIELLAVPGGARVVAATVAENGPWLAARLGLREAPFKPSLPTLVYQFSFFINYESQGLGEANAELP